MKVAGTFIMSETDAAKLLIQATRFSSSSLLLPPPLVLLEVMLIQLFFPWAVAAEAWPSSSCCLPGGRRWREGREELLLIHWLLGE